MSAPPADDHGGHRSGKEGRSTLLGLVRKVSRSAKTRDGSRNNNSVPSSSALSPSSSSSGYKKVSPNLAPTTAYSMGISPGKEKIVWGPPPASKTNRTIEGVELADDGPVAAPVIADEVVSTWSSDNRKRTPRKRHQHQRTLSPASMKMDLDGVAEVVEGASPRRSIDSLLPSMSSHIPLLSYAERDHAGGMKSTTPRRAVSVRVDGPKLRNRDSMAVSSTTRAKPGRESLMPLNFTSPYQGYWTNHRSDETEAVDEEAARLREVFRNKGPLWAVSRGWKKGVFMTFEEAEQQTRNFPGPLMRQFPTVDEAVDFLQAQSAKGKSPSSITFAEDISHDAATRVAGTPPRAGVTRLPSYQRSPDKSEFQRVLRSPSTNPFLTESERLRSSSASEGSGDKTLNLNRSLSNSFPASNALAIPVPRSRSREGTVLEKSTTPRTVDLLLPPPIVDSNGNGNATAGTSPFAKPLPSPTCTSIFYCADVPSSVDFYCRVAGFVVCTDAPQHEEQTWLSYKNAQHPSLALRKRIADPSLATAQGSSTSIALVSNTLLAVPPADLPQLHADLEAKLNEYRSSLKDERSRTVQVESIQGQKWGSSEFSVTDVDGNRIIFASF